MGAQQNTLTIVIHRDFLEFVDLRNRRRAVRRLDSEDIRLLQSLEIYPFRI